MGSLSNLFLHAFTSDLNSLSLLCTLSLMIFDIDALSLVLEVNQPGFSILRSIALLGPQGTQVPCSGTAVRIAAGNNELVPT